MKQRLLVLALSCGLLLGVVAQRGLAAQGGDGETGAVWTAIIPDTFPNYIYTWHIKDDGTYREDGRDARSNRPIQRPLSGRWSQEESRMLLRQDDLPYVFDGVVLKNLYAGTLYFNGRDYSRFCAMRGDTAPDHCDRAPSVAMDGAADGR
jgi:hypothetical protein